MEELIRKNVAKINRSKQVAYLLMVVLGAGQAMLMAYITFAVGILIDESKLGPITITSLLIFLSVFVHGLPKRPKKLEEDQFRLRLDMDHSQLKGSPYAADDRPLKNSEEWKSHILSTFVSVSKSINHQLMRHFSALTIPLVIVGMIHISTNVTQVLTSWNFLHAFSSFQDTIELQVLRGDENAKIAGTATSYLLKGKKVEKIVLAKDNLIKIVFTSPKKSFSPVVELRDLPFNAEGKIPERSSLDLFQSFKLSKSPIKVGKRNEYQIQFSVDTSLVLFIPDLFGNTPIAELTVNKPPVPKVTLSMISKLRDPWPDNLPVELKITAKTQQPLDKVELKIYSGKSENSELVSTVMRDDIFAYEETYELLLESYLTSDLAEVIIVAEATDRSLPEALVGRSQPIKLTVASAYGRYRRTLQTLRELKSMVDEKVSENKGQLDKESSETIERAVDQSQDSPFFDGIDRMQLGRFQNMVKQVSETENHEQMMELSEDLNHFLLEHELIDDRERDRDYFVAVRGLSRLIEKKHEERKARVSDTISSMKTFLDDRQQRWGLRIKLLPDEFKPESWRRIQTQPFKKMLDKVEAEDNKKTDASRDEAFTELSESANVYRKWIEELEKAEDDYRQKLQKERQQGLASSQDTLKEIRRRQSKISQDLDKANSQSLESLQEKWTLDKMEQNANVKATKTLEAQMRSLSPLAAMRIKAAWEQMQSTVSEGSKGDKQGYVKAESHSDLAGRLLIQAQNAAQKAQRQQGQQRGRRKRVTGDNYYGDSISGGDTEIKHEYEVDKIYRDDVLDQISRSQYRNENEELYNNYLREIIR